MNFNCSVDSAGESIDIYSERDIYLDFSRPLLLRDHLEFRVSRDSMNSGYCLYYKDTDKISIVYTDNSCHFGCPWDITHNGETLLYSMYPLLEAQRQARNWLTAYSAAVSMGSKGILLLGKSGAGKTSVAVDLCLRYGAQLAGNDLSILGLQSGKVMVKGGTKFIFMRQESIKRSLPELIDYFPVCDGKDPWRHKIKVDPDKVNISVQSSPFEINNVYFVHIDENYQKLYVMPEKDLASKLFINENFSRYIKGCCLNLLGGTDFRQLGFIPSYDNEQFFNFRQLLIFQVMSRAKYISGPLKMITEYIVETP